MSRAVFAVVMYGSRSPESRAQSRAVSCPNATFRSIEPSGAGYGTARSTAASSGIPQVTGVLKPMPRGSKPIRSKAVGDRRGDVRQQLAREVQPGPARTARVEDQDPAPQPRFRGRDPGDLDTDLAP